MSGTDLAVFLPNLAGGGAERVMVTLSNALAARGKRVDLVLAKAEGPYLDQVDREHVTVVDLACNSYTRWTPALAAYLRRTGPTVLLSALAHANTAAILARRFARAGTRIVISERNTLSRVVRSSRRPFVSMLPHLLRFVYPSADGIIAVSRGVADDLSATIGLARGRIDVVYNPAFTDDIERLREAPVPHPWLGPEAVPVILTAGRLISAKNHADLLAAFALVRRSRPCRLVVLGEGPLRADLERQVSDLGIGADVLLPGFVGNPFAWMRRAELFVLSSRHEGLPGVLIQAMACGTPVVSTDCPSGPSEILENGKWGRLVPVGDPAALAEAIAATLDEDRHPDVERRAADFSLDRALEGYARVMGMSL